MVTYRVLVRGALPRALETALRQRFDTVRLGPAQDPGLVGCTAIECTVRDQAALRALLTQLWDVGGEVALLADVTPAAPDVDPPAPGQELP